MLSPEYLAHCSDIAEQMASELHTEIINQIVKAMLVRMKRGDDYLLTAKDKYLIETLQEAGYLLNDIHKELASYNIASEKEIKEAMEEAGVEAIKNDDKIYKAAGLETVPLTQDPFLIRQMERAYKATNGTMRNLTRTTVNSAYDAFVTQTDWAYKMATTGVMGYTEAFRKAIDNIISDGIKVVYPSGHKDTIETATLRAVRTGISQMSADIQIARMDEMGVDLVLVSSHLGARPSHQVWQGKVYSRSGADGRYPQFDRATGYGTVTGLCGANCRHNFGPYFEGMENPFDDYDKEENLKAYDAEQKQRGMERAIRKNKRMLENYKTAHDNATDPAMIQEYADKMNDLKARIKLQNANYSAYCDKNNLRPLPERLRIAKQERIDRKNVITKNTEKVNDPESKMTDVMKKQYDSHIKKNGLTSVTSDNLPEGKIVGADYRHLTANVKEDYTDTLSKLCEEYDTPLSKIKTMEKDEAMFSNAFASTSHNYETDICEIRINPVKCRNRDEYIEKLKKLSDTKYAIKCDPDKLNQYVPTHEFAHTFADMQTKLNKNRNWVNADYKKITSFRKEIEKAYNDYLEELKTAQSNIDLYKPKEAELMNKLMTGNVSPDLEKEWKELGEKTKNARAVYDDIFLSRYSLTNSDEFMAEAFTEARIGERQSKYSIMVVDIINKYFRR